MADGLMSRTTSGPTEEELLEIDRLIQEEDQVTISDLAKSIAKIGLVNFQSGLAKLGIYTDPKLGSDIEEGLKSKGDKIKGFLNYLISPQSHFFEGGLSMLPSADDDKTTKLSKKGIIGDTVFEYAREPFAEAKERFMSAGKIETRDDESQTMKALRPLRRAGDYVSDMTMAGLSASEGGYALFAGAIGELFGGKDPESEKRLARDIMAMPEAFAGMIGGSVNQLDDAVDSGLDTIGLAYNKFKNYVHENYDTSGGTLYSFSGMMPPVYKYDKGGTRPKNIEVDFRNPVTEYLQTIKIPKNGITGTEIIRKLEKEPSISNASIPYDTIDKDKKYVLEDFLDNTKLIPTSYRDDERIIDYTFDPGSFEGETSDRYSNYQRQVTFAGVSNTGLMGLKPLDTFSPETGYFFDTINFDRQSKKFRTTSHSNLETIAHVRSTIVSSDNKILSTPLKNLSDITDRTTPKTLRSKREITLRPREEYGRFYSILPDKTNALLLDEIQSDMVQEGTKKPVPIMNTEDLTKSILFGTPDGKTIKTEGLGTYEVMSLDKIGDFLRAFDNKKYQLDFPILNKKMSSKKFKSELLDVILSEVEFEKKSLKSPYFLIPEAAELRGKNLDERLMPLIYPDSDVSEFTDDYTKPVSEIFVSNIDEKLNDFIDKMKSKVLVYEEIIEDSQQYTTMVPLKNTQEVADTGLKTLIARADKNNVDYIVIPSVDQIRAARAMSTSKYLDNKDLFYRLYKTNLDKSIDDLKKNFPMVTVHKDVKMPYDKRIMMGYTAPRYATPDYVAERDGIDAQVNFEGKGKKITGASDEGTIIDISKLRDQYDVQSPRFGGQRVEPKKSNPSELGFNTPVYHFSVADEIKDDILDTRNTRLNVFDAIGPHVGTKKAAEKRQKDLQKIYGKKGMILPLRARLDKPLKNEDGYIMDEYEVEDFLNKRLASLKVQYANEVGSVPNQRELIEDLRQDLADEGYTHIPYQNFVEDPDSISYIMLTDRHYKRGDKAVLRSEFGEFNPDRITEPELGKYQGGLV